MKIPLEKLAVLALIAVGLTFSSCGNIDIVKRKYRPGFHVNISKKKQERKVAQDLATVDERLGFKKTDEKEMALNTIPQKKIGLEEIPVATADSKPLKLVKSKTKFANTLDEIISAPFKEMKRENLGKEMRRAVFDTPSDEKSGWSVVGFVSTGLAIVALALIIVGLALLVSFISGGGFGFWWIFSFLGVLFGIGAMVTGIIGMRQTGSGEKRGRGFALGGMIGGIVSLALGLVGLFWGLIYWVIQRNINN